MKNFWLVTTDHLEDGLWFRDEKDFIVAMNLVAVMALGGKVSILAFILMSNHLHFVLEGSREDALRFINSFKRRYSMYLRRKYGVKEFLRENDVDMMPVPQEPEALERVIAYVQMNCVAANICSHPSQYPWGTGSVFFNPAKPSGITIGSLSKRACKRMIHSDFDALPKEWRICGEGYISPREYVAVQTVEDIFRSPKRLNYFLMSSSKAKKRIELSEEHLPAFRDQTILAVFPDLCASMFGKKSYEELTSEEQTECIRQIKYRFSANVNQIARICGISYEEAAKKINGL